MITIGIVRQNDLSGGLPWAEKLDGEYIHILIKTWKREKMNEKDVIMAASGRDELGGGKSLLRLEAKRAVKYNQRQII